MNNKVYECIICKQQLAKDKVYRLSRQRENGTSRYKAFVVERNYDFCVECYKKVIKCIKKVKREMEKEQ